MDKAMVWEQIRLLHPEVKPEHFSFDDPYMLGEIIARNTYNYAPAPGDLVMDIGANVGVFTALCLLNGAKVVAFEPHPEAFKILTDTVKRTEKQYRAVLYPCAIWKCEGTISYKPGKTEAGSHPDMTWDSYNGSVFDSSGTELPCLSLVRALCDQEWDCVKMDIEGAEFEVLFACPEESLRKIKYLTLELHNGWADKARHDALIEKLSRVFTIIGVLDGDPRFYGQNRFISVFAKRKATA